MWMEVITLLCSQFLYINLQRLQMQTILFCKHLSINRINSFVRWYALFAKKLSKPITYLPPNKLYNLRQLKFFSKKHSKKSIFNFVFKEFIFIFQFKAVMFKKKDTVIVLIVSSMKNHRNNNHKNTVFIHFFWPIWLLELKNRKWCLF